MGTMKCKSRSHKGHHCPGAKSAKLPGNCRPLKAADRSGTLHCPQHQMECPKHMSIHLQKEPCEQCVEEKKQKDEAEKARKDAEAAEKKEKEAERRAAQRAKDKPFNKKVKHDKRGGGGFGDGFGGGVGVAC